MGLIHLSKPLEKPTQVCSVVVDGHLALPPAVEVHLVALPTVRYADGFLGIGK